MRDAVRRQWQVEESLRVHFGSEGSTTTTYAEVTDQMHASTRELCQRLKADNLPQKPFVQEGMSKNIIEYQQHLSALATVVLRRLSTTVEEETTSKSMLHTLSERAQLAASEALVLQEKLKTLRVQHEKQVLSLDQTLDKLNAELRGLTQSASSNMNLVHEQIKKQIAKLEREHAVLSTQQTEKITSLTQDIETQNQTNNENEATLRKKKERMETDLVAQVVKYDEDMARLQRQADSIKAKLIEEQNQLLQLESCFDRVDEDKKRRWLELEILASLKGRAHAAGILLAQATINIQKNVRSKQSREFVQHAMKKNHKNKSTK